MAVKVHIRLECDEEGCRAVMDAYADPGSTRMSDDAESKGWVTGHDTWCPLHRDNAKPKPFEQAVDEWTPAKLSSRGRG